MDAVRRAARRALPLVVLLGACLAEPLRQEEIDALGPEVGEESPRHRPGQPCLVCHGEDRIEDDAPVFELAGTVYLRQGDTMGANDIEVRIADAAGAEYRVHSNRAGNFMIEVDRGLDAPLEDAEGILYVPAPLVLPLKVSVHDGATARHMRGVIHRERSCSACHAGAPGAASPGQIFVQY
jgi:hypothetical protein